MIRDIRVECQVDIPVEKQSGNFADAFRVVPLPGDEWALDFLAVSECKKQALIVARVRVDKEFLSSIRDRVDSTLEGIHGNLTQKQVDEMWKAMGQIPQEQIITDGELPLFWFLQSSEKVN